MRADLDGYPPRLAVGVTSSRIRALDPAARAVHTAILRSFATDGHAPDPATLADATPGGHDLRVVLRGLHDRDVIRLDRRGRIGAAYPFSAGPTVHNVAIAGGPTVWAMCAIDALGMADMLGRDVTITSIDPASGEPVQVTVHNGQASWEPPSAVVFVGSQTAAPDAACSAPSRDPECTVAAADRCCGVMNFFVGPGSAQAWLAAQSGVSGVVLTQAQAWRLAADIFGHLLDG